MHDEARKRLWDLLGKSFSFISKVKGVAHINNPQDWIQNNKAICNFLRKANIPVNEWQLDRILKKIGNDCINVVRKQTIDQTDSINVSDSRLGEILREIPFPNEMAIKETLSIFENQPFRYSFFLPLNQATVLQKEIEITDEIKIVPESNFPGDFLKFISDNQSKKKDNWDVDEDTVVPTFSSLTRINKIIDRSKIRTPNKVPNNPFIRLDLLGLLFIPVKFEPELSIIRSRLRQFLSILEIFNLLDFNENEATYDNENHLIFIRFNGNSKGKYDILSGNFSEAIIFKSIILNEQYLDVHKLQIKKIFTGPHAVFSRLWSALDWYGRSLMHSIQGSDETLEFVSYMTAIEALLGADKPKDSMTESLADKVSFFLGTNTQERNHIRDQFLDLYKFRSELIHGRLNYLTFENLSKLKELKELTKKIIGKEIASDFS